MSGELIFLIVTVAIVAIAYGVMQVHKHRYRIKRLILARLDLVIEAVKRRTRKQEPDGNRISAQPLDLTAEEQSEVELERIQERIEDKKQIARDSDLSYHLWGLYKGHFRTTDPHSLSLFIPDGEWYDVKIIKASSQDGLNEFDFELKGNRYKFVDDEERQGWSDNAKLFSLFLYDGSGRCLIEIPMKVKVHMDGRTYSILSGGPRAFLPGAWINEFINVKLKQQSKRNREIRTQKHKERLSEIQDLKDRFGISD